MSSGNGSRGMVICPQCKSTGDVELRVQSASIIMGDVVPEGDIDLVKVSCPTCLGYGFVSYETAQSHARASADKGVY